MGGGASRAAQQQQDAGRDRGRVALEAERSAAAAAMGAPSVRDAMAVTAPSHQSGGGGGGHGVGHGGGDGGGHVGWDEADQEVIRLLARATSGAVSGVERCWAAVGEEADLQEALWLSAAPSATASSHGGEAVLATLRDGLAGKDSGRIAEAVASTGDAASSSSANGGSGISAALREAADALATAEQNVFIWRRLGAGVEDSDRLEIEAWVDGVDDSTGGAAAQAVAGARRFLDRLVDRERRALERLEGQQAMYAQIEFGINTLDLGLLTALVSHAEASGLDSTPARLAMQDVRKKVQDKERVERDAAAAVAQAAEAAQAEATHWSREEREAQESADAAFAIAEQRRWRRQEKEAAAADAARKADQAKFEHWTASKGAAGGGNVFGGGGGSTDEDDRSAPFTFIFSLKVMDYMPTAMDSMLKNDECHTKSDGFHAKSEGFHT